MARYVHHHAIGRRHGKGFTTTELLIAAVVVAILMAIALPSFQSQMRKSRRTDAVNALTTVQLAQEKYRATNTSYAALTTLGFTNPYTSQDGLYTVALSGITGTGYTATATPVAGKSQASDSACPSIVLAVAAGSIGQTPTTCWNR